MKYLTLMLIFYIFCDSVVNAQNHYTSDIDKVTVFSKGAQVERIAKVRLTKGEQQIIIKNLPKNLNQSTITIKPESSVVKSMLYRIDYLKIENERVEKEKQLYQQKDSLENVIELSKVELEIIDEEVDFIKANRTVSGKLKGNSLEEIKNINEYYANRVGILYKKRKKLNDRISENQLLVNRIKQQVNYKHNKIDESAGELLIDLSSESKLEESLIISYFIEEASWYPSYDFRVDNVNSPMEATYLANVSQQTGEDWEEVKVVISSANPQESGRAPKMDVWRLDDWSTPPFGNNDGSEINRAYDGTVTGRVFSSDDGMGLPGVNIVVKGTTIGTVTDIDGNYSIQVPNEKTVLQYSFVDLKPEERVVGKMNVWNVVMEEEVNMLQEVVVTGYGASEEKALTAAVSSFSGRVPGVQIRGVGSLRQSITVNSNIDVKSKQVDLEFEINGRQTILSRPEKRSLDMLTYQLDVSYEYICSPRYNKNAFLFAYLTDWEDLNLLSGEVNLFYEGVYKGKTLLNANFSEDTLKISLGYDKRIKVELEDKSLEASKSLASKRKQTFDWVLSVRNLKEEPIKLVIKDQIPVSRNKLIEIELLEISDANYDEWTGYVDWELSLEPSEKVEKRLSYKVKYSNKVNFY